MTLPAENFLPQPSAEDSLLELLVETLDGLENSSRGQFLRQLFRTIAQLDLTEEQSNECWQSILLRRRELAGNSGRPVSLKTAFVDVLGSSNLLRVPILMEYDEFKKLRINAATDALTGLYNRRLFDEYCDKELNRAKRHGQQLAIVILDLHKLKDVNDKHGHLQGDRVLQLAAVMLRKTLRASDFAFRIGGDEFALLLPQTDSEQAITLCRRIRTLYESEVIPLKVNVGVTLDFGVAVHPQDGEQKGQLMGIADERLYELKHATRTSPRVVPAPEPQPEREAPPRPPPPSPLRSAAAQSGVATMPAPGTGSVPGSIPGSVPHGERRKWERVSLGGTKAHAVLTETGQKSARVIDLSYGGVAIEFDIPEDLPSQLNVVLHVPILPPVRVVLRRVYTLGTHEGRTRLGCAFVS